MAQLVEHSLMWPFYEAPSSILTGADLFPVGHRSWDQSWTGSGPVWTATGPGPVQDWDRTAVLPRTAGTGPSVRSSATWCGPVRSRSSVLPQSGQKTGQDRTLQHYSQQRRAVCSIVPLGLFCAFAACLSAGTVVVIGVLKFLGSMVSAPL